MTPDSPQLTSTQPTSTCPVCGGSEQHPVYDAGRSLPVLCNVLWPTAEQALAAPAGPIRLVNCPSCGHVWNAAFDEGLIDYSQRYENSLHFSPTFQDYATALARRLVEDHDLGGRTVVEVGCGKGDFLAMLLQAGAGAGVGYDPSYAGHQDGAADGIRFVPELFPQDPGEIDADIVCARHLLEHLARPTELVTSLARALDERRSVLYLEVPDGAYLLRRTALWDVIYEHPSHFTPTSMHRLLSDAGFSVSRVDTSFGGQYLWAEAFSGRAGGDAATAVDTDLATAFASRAAALVAHWSDRLAAERAEGRRIALWGTGSKGVTFLNLVPGAEAVADVVDVNPRKHGLHVPGTGQRVVGPDALARTRPDLVVVMNPLYVEEIERVLAGLGVTARVAVADLSDALVPGA